MKNLLKLLLLVAVLTLPSCARMEQELEHPSNGGSWWWGPQTPSPSQGYGDDDGKGYD